MILPEGRQRARVAAVVALIVLSAWTRLPGLSRLSWWADELPHVVVAESINDGLGPQLPSGRSYSRAALQSHLIAASTRAFGTSGFGARLPSALAGIALVLLVWAAALRRFGSGAALAAGSIVALSAPLVAHSRSARFYVLFAVAYGIAAVLGTQALRKPQALTIAGAVVAFAVAMHLQVLALTLAFPLGILALRAGRRGVVIAGAVGVAALLIVSPWIRNTIAHPVPGVDFEIGFRPGTFLAPMRVLSWWAWLLLLPTVLWLRRFSEDARVAVVHAFAPALLFAVLYDAHGRFDDRYLLQTMPFVAVLAGAAISGVRRMRPRTPRAILIFAALLASGSPAILAVAGEDHPGRRIFHPNWKAAFAVVRLDTSSRRILTTSPLAASVYVGDCGTWLRSVETAAPYVEGGVDRNCGVGFVSSGSQAVAFLDAAPAWVVADRVSWAATVSDEARAAVAAACEPVPMPDNTVLLYDCARTTIT